MTVDELIDRTVRNCCNLSCPVCGRIHLSREDIEQLENQKNTDSERCQQIRQQAEALDYAQQQGVKN